MSPSNGSTRDDSSHPGEERPDLRAAVEAMGHAVVVTNAEGSLVHLNPAAERLTGLPLRKATRHKLSELFAPDDESTSRRIAELLTGKRRDALTDQSHIVTGGGKVVRIGYTCAPLLDSSENTTGVVLVFRDISEAYAVQEQEFRKQRMDAFGQLTGKIAHDFNNLLGGIIGAAELIEEDDSPGERERMVQLILEAAERATKLTGNLLAFARKRPPTSSLVDVHDVIRSAVETLKLNLDPRIELLVRLEASQSKVKGDGRALENAVLNLTQNAIQAMPEGGAVDIISRLVVLDDVVCEASGFDIAPGDYVEVEVLDTGEGIPGELLPHLFEPYFTTRDESKGGGLGLAVVFGAVQQHRGAIHVYSELGKGSCFRVQFPLAGESTDALPRAADVIPGEGRILVVDDEPIMRATAEVILRHLGYSIVLASNGLEAVERYREEGDAIDLVLMDMTMPEMNGRDCFFALKKLNPEVVVVLSSGFSRVEDQTDLEEAGLRGFIRKPYHSGDLSQVIARALSLG